MTDDRSLERAARSWIDEGPTRAPKRAVERALQLIQATPQERDLRIPRRFHLMATPARVAAAAVVGVLAVGGALYVIGGPSPNVGGLHPTPSPNASPSPFVASPSPSAIASLNTATWTTYTSDRYGFSIAHPPEANVRPATRDWVPADAADWLTPAAEIFKGNSIRRSDGFVEDASVTAWSVALTPAELVDRPTMTWIEAYCPRSLAAVSSCTGIENWAVAVTMDGHPGTLVSFPGDSVQAFFLVDGRMYVIMVGRPESDGARPLLNAYLSTMRLLPGGPASASPSARPS